jgi:hypothetical protein
MTEQQQEKSTQPETKHITAKDYYDYMMDGDGFDFFSAAKKQYSAESNKKGQKKQEPEWESKSIEFPTQPATVATQVKTKYKLQNGTGFNPTDVQEFNCILKGSYYNWFSRIALLVLFFMGFLMPFLWIFFVITLITDKKQEAQFGIILKSGARGVINIKGKNNIIKFESELARSKYM